MAPLYDLTGARINMRFETLPIAEDKELKAFLRPHDPLDPLERPGRDTY
jgi:hypothetical protein